MKLMTDELRTTMPRLHATENEPDPVARVRFFTPWSDDRAWYGIEFDGNDDFFGVVVFVPYWVVTGREVELGFFSLSRLESFRGPDGECVERDNHFKPTTLSTVVEENSCPPGRWPEDWT